MLNITPDQLHSAGGHISRTWGDYGYRIEAIESPTWAVSLFHVCASDGWPVFLDDMARLARRQPLTDGQTTAAERIMREQTARAAERGTEAANARPVPTGKAITITGEVVHTRMDDNPYAYGRYVAKMLVKGDGWKVWSTIPAALEGETTAGDLYGLHGKTVRFVADVTVSRDDPSFGYAKRPRQAERLDQVTA